MAITFTLAGEPAPRVRTRTQAFSPKFIEAVEIGSPATFEIEITDPAKATNAYLRLCSLGPIPADIAAQFNGKGIGIPAVGGVIDVPIDPKSLKAANTLVIHPGATSFQVASVSLFVVSEKE
jgi:hypothetical protein